MPTVVVPMPRVGEVMEEGTVVKWLVEEGATVKAMDPIVVVDTDKVEYEVEASRDGTIARIIAQPGDVLPIGSPLCEMEVLDL